MPKRILLVDEDSTRRNGVESDLSEAGYEVLTAHEADDALFLAHMRHPDLIILEPSLPPTDGVSLQTMLRGHEDTRVIPVLTLAPDNGTSKMLEAIREVLS